MRGKCLADQWNRGVRESAHATFFKFFVCSVHFFVCSIHFFICCNHFFLFAAITFLFAAFTFLFAAFTFLFAAIVFCLQRFFFFAASPLWAIVLSQSDARDLFTSIIGLSFPGVSLFPGIKLRCTVKYIQDEHGEKRRKNEHF